jgi:hypothetical protein
VSEQTLHRSYVHSTSEQRGSMSPAKAMKRYIGDARILTNCLDGE